MKITLKVNMALMSFYVGRYYWQVFDSHYGFLYTVEIRKGKFRRTK